VRLPGAGLLVVPQEKVVDYLLSPSHPEGHTRAQLLAAFGFTQGEWGELAEALRDHGARCDVASRSRGALGVKYSVEGPLECPDGRTPWFRTVWFVETGARAPRLVTAYPCRRRAER
jgi:hypothetical protein